MTLHKQSIQGKKDNLYPQAAPEQEKKIKVIILIKPKTTMRNNGGKSKWNGLAPVRLFRPICVEPKTFSVMRSTGCSMLGPGVDS